MSVRDRVGRASFHAVSAKNAAVVIDVVNLGVPLRAAYATCGGIVGGLDVDAVRRARRRAQEAGYTFLQPVLVALQDVSAAKASLNARPAQRPLSVGIILHDGGLKHLHEGDAHALGNRGDVL